MIGNTFGNWTVTAYLDKDRVEAQCRTCNTRQPVFIGAWQTRCRNENCGRDTNPALTEWRGEHQKELDQEARQQELAQQAQVDAIRSEGHAEGRQEAIAQMKDANQALLRQNEELKSRLLSLQREHGATNELLATATQEISDLQKQVPKPIPDEELRLRVIDDFCDNWSSTEVYACARVIQKNGWDARDPDSWTKAYQTISQNRQSWIGTARKRLEEFKK